MWILAVIGNVAIAIACWRVVFWVLRFRLAVAHFRQQLVNAEANCRSGLALAPDSLWIAQERSMQFRQWQRQGRARWVSLQQFLQQGVQALRWGKRLIRVQAQLRLKQGGLKQDPPKQHSPKQHSPKQGSPKTAQEVRRNGRSAEQR